MFRLLVTTLLATKVATTSSSLSTVSFRDEEVRLLRFASRRLVDSAVQRESEALERFFHGHLDDHMLFNRSMAFAGDPFRVQKVLQRAKSGQPITVCSLGGSITAGGYAGLEEGAETWDALFVNWMKQKFGQQTIHAKKLAAGGRDSIWGAEAIHSILQDFLPSDTVLLVVEFGVNDCRSLLHGKRPDSGRGRKQKFSLSTTFTSVEKLVRWALGHPNLALMFLETFDPEGCSGDQMHSRVTDYYGVPQISWNATIGPDVVVPKGHSEYHGEYRGQRSPILLSDNDPPSLT